MSKATYSKCTASNGVVLHYLKASPNDVQLRANRGSVCGQSATAINGGFFDFASGSILSIAVQNDKPIKGNKGDYGSGWRNAKYPRGTLAWDATARRYLMQIVQSADELNVTDRNRYWAQGGISMSLQDDRGWEKIARQQNMPNIYGKAFRTAIVYGTGLNLWLIVTNTRCSAAEFRAAVKQKIGSGTLADGIFLDGSGSSQLRCAEALLKGDGRTVCSIITV
ncbi:phosphodiester glycosidase family protein [Paenibacillus apiarius]|uniref:phosphodiester glycosidase family protein n=1 Tax=Paenibacillus apiarius TaxID=46240 RepID=UPI003B3BE66E